MQNYIGVKKLSSFDDMKYFDIYKPNTPTLQIPYQLYDIYNTDNPMLNNWSSNFDWNVANPSKYITNLTGLSKIIFKNLISCLKWGLQYCLY